MDGLVTPPFSDNGANTTTTINSRNNSKVSSSMTTASSAAAAAANAATASKRPHHLRSQSQTRTPVEPVMDLYRPSTRADASIADLCAQTVCFLWFESLATLHEAAHTTFPVTRLPQMDALAKREFVNWTRTVLQTTQVSSNVVILAMLYIYRLKLANPGVRGKAGSEYRLLTVALMLGNKFLDDNTYTNKTWSDVTAIPVREIHLMEVEFLSNMRYQLNVTAEEWRFWLSKINAFKTYAACQRQLLLVDPTDHAAVVGLPSPPHFIDANAMGLEPASASIGGLAGSARKRSFESDISSDHSVKRIMSQPTTPRRSTRRNIAMPQYVLHPLAPQGLPPMQGTILSNSGMPVFMPGQPPAITAATVAAAAAAQNSAIHHGQGHAQQQQQQQRSGARPVTRSSSGLLAPQQQHLHATAPAFSPLSLSLGRSPGGNGMTGGSPALSPVSRYSLDSMARVAAHHQMLQHHPHHSQSQNLATQSAAHPAGIRHSPYGPAQPVHTLVTRYMPPDPAQMVHRPEELWYQPLSRDTEVVRRGRVPYARVSPLRRPSAY
ncbi:hypothetical protein PYCC9005_004790 [Savitreella phatthalungensis]